MTKGNLGREKFEHGFEKKSVMLENWRNNKFLTLVGQPLLLGHSNRWQATSIVTRCVLIKDEFA